MLRVSDLDQYAKPIYPMGSMWGIKARACELLERYSNVPSHLMDANVASVASHLRTARCL